MIETLLQAYYQKVFPERSHIRIWNLSSLTTGWENEMYAFNAEYEAGAEQRHEKLVLRIYPGDDAYVKSGREFYGMNLLLEHGYPVPRVWLLERENSPFGRPFLIMDRVDGQSLWSLLFDPAGEQREWLELFCALFVRLHALDWRPFDEDLRSQDPLNPYRFIDRWLDWAHEAITRLDSPGFSPLIEWLKVRRTQIPCTQPAVVHWDFHPNNILVRADGSPAVIDWSGMRVSDPRFDLGWTLLLARSYLGLAWRNRILQSYQDLSGVDVEQVGCFEVWACLRRLFDIFVSLSEGAEKMGMRPGASQAMREQIQPLRKVYAFMLETTGIEIPEINQLLERRE